uniref:Capping protein (actin filament), gelsolin-like b n=1 Tax=Astyanax mexicanus TaxID=7994 RepID=A0A8B9KGD2_ASTMX
MLPFQAAPGQFGPEVREPGLRCWRVEKMKAVALDPSEVGAFFNGDSYLVLENRGDQGADLHMWIGEKSSRDEQVACAMLATQLDNFLGGEPVQHRQVQGYESPEFMNLFPRGISYKEGGVESGFRRSQSGSGPVQRLYHIKGKKNIRAKEVELSWDSFNKGDCFILDLGEVRISCEVISLTGGEGTVLGPVPALKESSPEDDSQADVSNSASLYKVSDATGSMKLTKVSEKKPIAKDLLLRDDCFILDNGANGKIFVWKGMYYKALSCFCVFFPQVEILPQGRETVMFKQFFQNWN